METAEDGGWRMHGEGRDRGVGAGVKASMVARVEEVDALNTDLIVSADVQFSGRLAELGQPLIKRKADSMVEDFAKNLGLEVTREQSASGRAQA